MSNKDAGWWDEFFPLFRPLFSIISDKETKAQTAYFIAKLNLNPGQKFLDCPCGIGRISIPMAKKGIIVTGVDITKSYLEELDLQTRKKKLNVNTIHSDMRRINFTNEFHAAGNLWTSFGFFEKDSDNYLALKKMFQALKPGGKFMLHVINRDWVLANFAPYGWYKGKDFKILEEREFDFSKSISRTKWYFMKKGEEKVLDSDIRMYSYHELLNIFKKIGFINIEGFGSVDDDPISLNHRMMFIIGTKPEK